ncbi:MAG: D-alanine--D-alanine ligase [Deltaproteobacteria bacterium]|nr:D-alanine--D-alanine ligase [Candidatus Anaeroferrophillacea bacterium]
MNTIDRGTLRRRTIGVLYGGLSAERLISLKTGAAVLETLRAGGYRAVGIDVDRQIAVRLVEHDIDVAFIALHGRYGEDGTIQGLLEYLGIPYTGPGVLGSSLAMHKVMTKRILAAAGIPTPEWVCCLPESPPAVAEIGIDFPVVVKPVSEGSSLGITVVEAPAGLPAAVAAAGERDREVLIERYIAGTEITVSVLDGVPLPLIQIEPLSGLYDYEAKYTPGKTVYRVPAPLAAALTRTIQELAVASCQATACTAGAVRVDFRLAPDRTPWVIEINTVPGMTATSLLPKAAAAGGLTFIDLLERMLTAAALHVGV